ncbi:hypothetical protein AKG60_03315 [Vibrio parahaemolyticus]|uniref:Uncharacterized protein n=1 Tax=Vibrio parahaemolyticus TaxID=670 RepID=A0AAX0MII7_VIBPH|nr:hypothetical protein [Vibrio vulnificus]EGQ8301808.1 hypothetical protein [Vibrio parahaemolyticus]MCS0331055.1 hypothetical protein [Vibrio diabolicus]ARN69149.1 hypothetical protein FORC36_4632 [Vibrio vulnificus]EGQ8892033.1 hypothetical protein [Vibrio parahaemolyticus]EGR3309128.1 hypothetical protein [Vibrio parahaemolyticus]
MVIIEYLLDCKTVQCKPSEVDNYVSSGRIEYRNVGARMVQGTKLVQLEALVYFMIGDLHKDNTLDVREKQRMLDELKLILFFLGYDNFIDPFRRIYGFEFVPVNLDRLKTYRDVLKKYPILDSISFEKIVDEMEESKVCLEVVKQPFFNHYFRKITSCFCRQEKSLPC